MNILILSEKDQISENIFSISDDRFKHIKSILKLQKNDHVEVGILNGLIGKAKIVKMDENYADLELTEFYEDPHSSLRVDIICALPRPQTLKKVLNTSATMGVNNLYLIRSEKVEKSYFHSPLLNEEKYNKYLIEGLSQGKRTNLPKVSIHKKFKVFFEDDKLNFSKSTLGLLADPSENRYLEVSDLKGFDHIIFAIGPEGGWNNFELEYMIKKGFKKFKLSENILRVENAVTASMAQIELLSNQVT